MKKGSTESTRVLVERVIVGDRDAFTGLVDRYRDAACAVAYSYFGGFDDVQDAVQEAFVHAYCQLHQLREPAKFGPWLRRITSNACAMALRKRERSDVSLDDVSEQPATSGDPQRIAARVVVREALGKLSEGTRLAVTLSYIDGYSHAEVAEFLDLPVNTVRTRLQYAKRKLRKEMMDMVSDVLHESKPGDELSAKVILELVERAHQAEAACEEGDAVRAYDEAIEAIDRLTRESDPEQVKRDTISMLEELARNDPNPEGARRIVEMARQMEPAALLKSIKADCLWQKGWGSSLSRLESVELLEQALALRDEAGITERRAEHVADVGFAYATAGMRDKAVEHYRAALEEHTRTGDIRGQAKCLLLLGNDLLPQKEPAEGRELLQQALALFEQSGIREPSATTAWTVVMDYCHCRAALAMLDDIEDQKLADLVAGGEGCDVLLKEGSVVASYSMPNYHWLGRTDLLPLHISGPIWQMSHLNRFLDSSVPVGGSWSGNVRSFSHQPAKATVTVVSECESVTVPAGHFERCLLMELVTEESDLPDDSPESNKVRNRRLVAGTRRAWFAPGVGLVQLHVQTAEGSEALIQLKEFEITEPSTDYFPLAIGNSWAYGWADTPTGYVAKEAYRVAAHHDDLWHLEHYHYVLKPK